MELKLKKLLPLLDDEELNLLADKIAESETGEYEGVKASQLLPYLSEEKAGELMIATIKQGRDAHAFGPYVSEQAYRDMAELYGQYDFDIASFFCYMDDAALGRLAERAAKGEIALPESKILPYLSAEKAGELMIAVIKQGRDAHAFGPYASEQAYRDMAELYGQYDFDIAPFFCYMDDAALSRLAERAAKGEITLPESKILPYLDEKKTDELFLSLVREGKEYRALLPFVSDACWNRLADEYEAGTCDAELVDDVYVYMDDAAVKKIFKAHLNKQRGGENSEK